MRANGELVMKSMKPLLTGSQPTLFSCPRFAFKTPSEAEGKDISFELPFVGVNLGSIQVKSFEECLDVESNVVVLVVCDLEDDLGRWTKVRMAAL